MTDIFSTKLLYCQQFGRENFQIGVFSVYPETFFGARAPDRNWTLVHRASVQLRLLLRDKHNPWSKRPFLKNTSFRPSTHTENCSVRDGPGHFCLCVITFLWVFKREACGIMVISSGTLRCLLYGLATLAQASDPDFVDLGEMLNKQEFVS